MDAGNYHQGYLLIGDTEKATERAMEMTGDIFGGGKESIFSHPDFSLWETELFTIDNAREIREKSHRKSFFGKGRVFIIKTNFFSREAGNALLKTLEEPSGLSYFFIITNSSENILETLRSRLVVLKFEREGNLTNEQEELAGKFLSSTVDKRIEMMEDFIDSKNKTADLLDSLEIVLRKNSETVFSEKNVASLSELGNCRRLLFQRSSSPRMILDYLSCII